VVCLGSIKVNIIIIITKNKNWICFDETVNSQKSMKSVIVCGGNWEGFLKKVGFE